MVKYNVDTDRFYVKSDFPFNYGRPISNGSILNIWDIKQKGSPDRSLLLGESGEPYAINSLAIYIPQENPVAFWEDPSPEYNETSFKLLRAYGITSFDPPSQEEYTWVTEIPENQPMTFSDSSILDYPPSGGSVDPLTFYKVEAYSEDQILYTTNIVKIISIADWSKSLVLTIENNKPRIVWTYDPVYHPDENPPTGYIIHRKVVEYGQVPGNPIS